MREVAAIVQVDVAAIERAIQQRIIALKDGETEEETWSQKNHRVRIEIGQLLLEVRKTFGPRGDGFNDLLRRQGIPPSTANNWMALAGEAEAIDPDSGSKPETVKEALEARRQRRAALRQATDEQPDGPPPEKREPEVVHTKYIRIEVRVPEQLSTEAFNALKALARFVKQQGDGDVSRGLLELQKIMPQLREV